LSILVKSFWRLGGVCLLLVLCCETNAVAQAASAPDPPRQTAKSVAVENDNSATQDDKYWLQPGEDPENKLGVPFLKHLVADQEEFFTEPARFRVKDLRWGAPLMAGTAALIASDSWLAKQVPDKPNQLKRSKDISNYSALSLVGVGGGAFLLGEVTHNDHLSEAGLLSGEAAINATAVSYLFKAVTQRPRPYQANGNGTFFQGGSSFPSEHSAAAWAIASVWSHEYPGKLSQTLAYGLASAVTLTRVTGQQHFASDAAIGSLLGWYFGRSVYRAHHDPEIGGAPWGSLLPENTGDKTRNPENMGSPYVPVDNWVYPIFDRMAAFGYMHSGYAGMRPWTRMECARLVEEISEKLSDEGESNPEAQKMYDALAEEFSDETRRLDGATNVGATVDSVYTRSTVISGTPLRDGYHFGQTIINDYGRPYGEGFNNVSGVTAHAVAGPLSISIQGEYQHAPGAPSENSPQTMQAIGTVDGTTPYAPTFPAVSRLRLLDATVALTLKNVQVSFGQQSLWLGPGQSGPLLFSNNAEPIPMLRIDSIAPYRVPLISKFLGPMRSEFFLGQLSGQQWVNNDVTLVGPGINPQPFIHGTKVSFKPTENLEMGFSFTAMFGGPGYPFTSANFLRTFYSHTATLANNPAKRLSDFNFSYHVPGLRNWLVLYTDSLVIDEYSPLGSDRPVINPGIYLPKLPKIPKLDLRFEGATSDLNVPDHFGPGAVYFDERFHSGYTNNGNLMGSWVGRRGRGEQAWATYWFSPRDKIQLGYRHNDVDKAFLQGGEMSEIMVMGEIALGHDMNISGFIQYEGWNVPALSSDPRSNLTSSIQLTFRPRSWNRK
jgi:hypothetical protein